MKKYLLLIIAFCAFTAVDAQNTVNLNINHLMGDEAFELNTAVTIGESYDMKFTRMEYYISEISITHDGGMVTELEDVYVLVDAGSSEVFDLGSWDINTVESITFGLGVDSSVNNEDPGTYPSDHPLAYQSPSMHWGWATGYRFVAVEGDAGFDFLYGFEIHALGNSNYNTVTLNFTSTEAVSGILNIDIDADYTRLFDDNNVENGAIIHSDTHPMAVKTLENGRNYVFNSEGGIVSIDEKENKLGLAISPNPVTDNVLQVQTADWNSSNFTAKIIDVTGKVVLQEQVNGTDMKFDVSSLQSGVYLLELRNDVGELRIERFQK